MYPTPPPHTDDDTGGQGLSAEETARQIRHALTHLLSRREYSQHECMEKLTSKGWPAESVADVLAQFVSSGIQSDARFVFHFIRHAINKGQGWYRIRQSLSAHNIASPLVTDALTEIAPDWFALAHHVKIKRFGEDVATEPALKQKQMRFLQYRGFSHEEIRYAVET